MISKIRNGNNYLGLLNYLEKKNDRIIPFGINMILVLLTERICAEGFLFSLDISIDSDRELVSKGFEDWDSKYKSKRFDRNVAYFVLDFDYYDLINKENGIDIAKEFLERMGYKDIPMAIYMRNDDKDYNHIHIVTSRVGVDAKKIDHNYEARRAISICRELEVKYCLRQTKSREIKEKILDLPGTKAVMASADTAFIDTIVQNLQYYLNTERVKDMDTLQKMLLVHKIEMVLHDNDGNRLPRNGVMFYFKEGNKNVSYLSGKFIEKNFIANIQERLLRNI